jgi:hypothetical protein
MTAHSERRQPAESGPPAAAVDAADERPELRPHRCAAVRLHRARARSASS